MELHRMLATLVAAALLGAWTPLPHATPDACALLTANEVGAALEIGNAPGRRAFASSASSCIWSDDTADALNHRRFTLNTIPVATFDRRKTTSIPQFTMVPVTDVGDEAFYEQLRTHESPFLIVRKGGSAFEVRVLNGFKLKAFTLDQEKAIEAQLGKLAAGRL